MAITSMPEFDRRFRENFPDMGSSAAFLDADLSLITRRPRLDVVGLDTALIAKHGEYGGAMSAFIQSRYGVKAVQFVKDAL